MSTAQWILDCDLLGWVLARNLGTRPLTRGTFLAPTAIVVAGAGVFLRTVPTPGHDVQLELVGTGAGAALGLAAAALTRVRRRDGRVVVTATGADAWTAAFVLMALAMVLIPYLATGLVAAAAVRRTPATALGRVA